MPPIRTPLCDLLGIDYPVISAGMGGVAGATLAAAVSNAGGLGVIGATAMRPDALRAEIKKARSLTDRPFGVDLLLPADLIRRADRAESEESRLGYQTSSGNAAPRGSVSERHKEFVESLAKEWSLPELPQFRRGDPSAPRSGRDRSGDLVREQVQVVLEEEVPVFASGLGDPEWMVEEAHAKGMVVMGLVGNVRNARKVASGGTDVIIAQGHEAGGHTGRIGTMPLIPQVVDAVSPTLVVAAGGIADGRGLAAALCLGAVGVWCGTAFLATKEAFADVIEHRSEAEWRALVIKQKIVESTEEGTRVSRAITGKPARLIDTPLVQAWERPDAPPTLPMPLQGALMNNLQRRVNLGKRADLATEGMGQIAGMIEEIRPAGEVVSEMVEEAGRVLAALSQTDVTRK